MLPSSDGNRNEDVALISFDCIVFDLIVTFVVFCFDSCFIVFYF